MKKILYIDMDGVIADFDKAIQQLHPEILTMSKEQRSLKVEELCENNSEIFHTLELIPNAQEAVIELSELFDTYFLSTPMWNVPLSYTGKRIWLEKHFGEIATKRLILTHRKDYNIGHFLVDDRFHNGAGEFTGIHIHFGSDQFPNWLAVLEFLRSQT